MPPDAVARVAVLRVHFRERSDLTGEIEWDIIKELMEGYAASDLKLIASSAALKALKEARDADEIA